MVLALEADPVQLPDNYDHSDGGSQPPRLDLAETIRLTARITRLSVAVGLILLLLRVRLRMGCRAVQFSQLKRNLVRA
jgi:hypothetical protein